jgi:hypothetical protein
MKRESLKRLEEIRRQQKLRDEKKTEEKLFAETKDETSELKKNMFDELSYTEIVLDIRRSHDRHHAWVDTSVFQWNQISK